MRYSERAIKVVAPREARPLVGFRDCTLMGTARMHISLRSFPFGEVVGNILNGLECAKNRVVIGSLFVAAK
jgi:hypothetical protein